MATPIFDAGWSIFKDAQKAGELRGKIAGQAEILAALKAIKKPSREILAIIKKAEDLKHDNI